jgi:hypothetical protein
MKNKRILKEFISFLKHESVYTEYVNELEKGETYRFNHAIIKEKNELKWLINTIKKYPENLISDAFAWPFTIDDKCIDWMEISDKWVRNIYIYIYLALRNYLQHTNANNKIIVIMCKYTTHKHKNMCIL